MNIKKCALLLLVLVIGATLVALWLGKGEGSGENDMEITYAKPSPEVAEHEPFPSEIAAVEEAWGEPIPDELTRIGGVDGWSWARIWRDPKDPPGLFHGEFRDKTSRYEGPLRLSSADPEVLGNAPLQTFYMQNIDANGVHFIEAEGEPPLRYFTLEPVDREAWILAPELR